MRFTPIFLGLMLTAAGWAAPSAEEQAKFKPLLPTGQTLVDTVHLKLQTKADTVAITEKDGKFYLHVLPQGSKALLSVSTLDKKNCFLSPVQGPHQEKLSQLVYSHDLDHNGKPYLFVKTYMADVTGLHVFKATPKGYQEIFQESTNAEFTFDAKTGRFSLPATDADPAKKWQWVKGHFQPVK